MSAAVAVAAVSCCPVARCADAPASPAVSATSAAPVTQVPGTTAPAAAASPASPSFRPRFETVLRHLETDALLSPGTEPAASATSGTAAAAHASGTAAGPAPGTAAVTGTVDPVLEFKRAALIQGSAYARRNDFASAMKILAVVKKKLGPEDPFVDELKGTLLVMKKDYAGGEVSFRKMVTKLPDSVTGRFDLGESIFLQGRYEEAEVTFAYLDELERDHDPALADLCRFKRVMCLLAAGLIDRAASLLPAQSDPNYGSPAMRYGAAAVSYARKDFAAANSIIASTRAEMGEDVENLFADSFIELRWGGRDDGGNFRLASANVSPSRP